MAVYLVKPSPFAAILSDGSVVTWGEAGMGGDSSIVQDRLRWLTAQSSVATWCCGADSSKVQIKVEKLQANNFAFAAIMSDGSLVSWGSVGLGGDSSKVQDQLQNVQEVQGTSEAFAAILADGSVVTWGNEFYGGDSRKVQHQLKSVQLIRSSKMAFAAVLADGSVITWGSADHGGDSSAVQDDFAKSLLSSPPPKDPTKKDLFLSQLPQPAAKPALRSGNSM